MVNASENQCNDVLFSRYADDYWHIAEIFGLEAIYEGLAQDIFRTLPADAEKPRILDIGAGAGQNALPLLQANAHVHITLVDLSAEMMSHARHILQAYADRITLVTADINDYLLAATEPFTAVTSAFAIHNMQPTDRKRLFESLPRVLKPNAVFVAFDKYAVADEVQHQKDLRSTTNKFAQFTERGRPDLEQAWREHYVVDDAIRFTEAEQTQLLHLAGFKKVKWMKRVGLEATVCGQT